MGCGASAANVPGGDALDKVREKVMFRVRGHKDGMFLKALDARLASAIKDGSIKLVDADYLRAGVLDKMCRRQDLEALEKVTQPGSKPAKASCA
eukprot:1811318-Prymnesium_polylepis.2